VKRIGVFFVTAAICIQFSGMYCFFFFCMLQIRVSVEEKLAGSLENLEKVNLSILDYEELRIDESEILLEGKLYDVAALEIYNDSVTLYVLHDEEEENLLALMDSFIEKNNQRQKSSRVLLKYISSLYLASSFTLPFDNVEDVCPQSLNDDPYLSVSPSIATPPPKTITA
jgi:hypothetical protein